MHLFVVPTISFDLLYAFVIVRLDRRELVWINLTTNPAAESERGNRVAEARCHSNARSAICLVVQTMLHKE